MSSGYSASRISTIHRQALESLARSSDDRSGETVVEKALIDFSQNRADQAIKDLSKLWVGKVQSRGKVDPALEEMAMQFLIDMCLTTDRVSSIKEPLRQYNFRTIRSKVGPGPIERSIKYIVGRTEEMVTAVRGETTNANQSQESKLLDALGVNEEVSSSPFLKLPNGVCYLLCDRKIFYQAHQRMFMFCVSRLLDMCVNLNTPREVFTINRSVNGFCDLYKSNESKNKDYRTDALKHYTPEIAAMRFKLLATALSLGNWGAVRDALGRLSSLWGEVETAVKEHNKEEADKIEFPLAKVEIAEQRFRVVSDVFLENRNWVFHAHSIIQQSRFTSAATSEVVLNRAVLATLCVSHSQNAQAIKESNESYNGDDLASILRIGKLPSQKSLHEDILKKPDLHKAHPSALALLEMVSKNKVTDLTAVYTHLNALKATEWAAPYLAALERSLLEEYMHLYFTTKPVLAMSALASQVLFPQVNDVHLIAISCGATVDVMDHTACFNTSENTIRTSLEALNAAVGTALTIPVAKRRRELPAGKSLAVQMEREMALIEKINTQQNLCLANANARKESRKKKNRDEVTMKEEEARKQETAQRERQIKRSIEDTKKLLNKAEDNYRRKQCVSVIVNKYPGVNIPPNVANLDSTRFIESCVKILAPHTIKMEEAKSSAVRDANYLERAIREAEVPLRRAIENDEEAKAQHREEQAKRIQNFKDQHRAKYESAKALKDVMNTFRDEATKYMSEKVEVALASQKVTKRDAQEEDLEAEKRRIAALAGETVSARPAAAAQPKPAAEATPAPAAAAPTAAKWVPRSKRE